jgi:hypothetical protein
MYIDIFGIFLLVRRLTPLTATVTAVVPAAAVVAAISPEKVAVVTGKACYRARILLLSHEIVCFF